MGATGARRVPKVFLLLAHVTLVTDVDERDLIHDVVHTVKNNLKVDWTEPHREDVKVTVRAAVRRELRRRNVRQQDLEPFLGYILDQAKEIYADWPVGVYSVGG